MPTIPDEPFTGSFTTPPTPSLRGPSVGYGNRDRAYSRSPWHALPQGDPVATLSQATRTLKLQNPLQQQANIKLTGEPSGPKAYYPPPEGVKDLMPQHLITDRSDYAARWLEDLKYLTDHARDDNLEPNRPQGRFPDRPNYHKLLSLNKNGWKTFMQSVWDWIYRDAAQRPPPLQARPGPYGWNDYQGMPPGIPVYIPRLLARATKSFLEPKWRLESQHREFDSLNYIYLHAHSTPNAPAIDEDADNLLNLGNATSEEDKTSQVDRLKVFRTIALSNRASVLDRATFLLKTPGQKNSPLQLGRYTLWDGVPPNYIRNMWVHGGDVTSDALLCRAMAKGPNTKLIAERWEKTFQVLYHVSVNVAQRMLEWEELEQVLNLHCGLRIYDQWSWHLKRLDSSPAREILLVWKILERAHYMLTGKHMKGQTMRTDYDPPDMKLSQYQHFFSEEMNSAERNHRGQEDREQIETAKDKFKARQDAEEIHVEELLCRTYGPNHDTWPARETMESALQPGGTIRKLIRLLTIPIHGGVRG